jgi:hypothetical protein
MARLAPYRPMQHALGGGAGLVLNIVGAAATWNRGLGPIGIYWRSSRSRCRLHGLVAHSA